MKRWTLLLCIMCPLIASQALSQDQSSYGKGSVILDVEGHACMGDELSRKQTRLNAITETKRKAAEMALTHIQSESKVKDFVLDSDILSAYTNAKVRIIEELDKGWFKDQYSGECYRIKLKAEVIP